MTTLMAWTISYACMVLLLGVYCALYTNRKWPDAGMYIMYAGYGMTCSVMCVLHCMRLEISTIGGIGLVCAIEFGLGIAIAYGIERALCTIVPKTPATQTPEEERGAFDWQI